MDMRCGKIGRVSLKTNAEAFKDSYVEAMVAFNHWCEEELGKGSGMCTRNESCEVCQARWYALPFDREEYARMVADVGEREVKDIPGNEDADRMFVEAGLLKETAEFKNPGRHRRSGWRRKGPRPCH